MYHDRSLARRVVADPRPRSAVSPGVGMAGLVGMAAWIAVACHYGMDGPNAALTNLLACGIPMVLWAVLVDKVHRNPSTGIDWSMRRPWREVWALSSTKLTGLWVTWGAIALIYFTGRFYWEGNFAFAMAMFELAAPVLVAISIPYVLFLDRRLADPKDGAHAFGAWLMGAGDPDWPAIANHLRSWGVKAFFTAFMVAIVPGGFGDFVRGDVAGVFSDPVRLANWLITFMFVVDVAFATVGYILTVKPLDSHIRSANPYAAGWAAALICYPPFIMMSPGGPFDYSPGTADWSAWYAGHPLLLAANGAVLVILTGIYAWATVAFGFRFSNLTNRGIITNGPYAFSRHPAYLAKNSFWWLASVPVLTTTGDWRDAVRNTLLLGVVSLVYYLRARTEERHLLADPDYQAYHSWMARNGLVPRLFARLAGKGQKRVSS